MKRTRRSRQISLFEGHQKLRRASHFGGALVGKNNAKEKRPFSAKHPMHVVLRSTLAHGPRSLLNFSKRIRYELIQQTKKRNIEVISFANAGNHLHLLVRAPTREDFRAFIRGFAATVARLVTGANRNEARLHAFLKRGLNPDRRKARFWDFIPWSTIISNFVALKKIREYLGMNRLESYFGIDRRASRRFTEVQREIAAHKKRGRAPPLIAFGF